MLRNGEKNMCCHFKNAIKFPIIIALFTALLFGGYLLANFRSSRKEKSNAELLSRIYPQEIQEIIMNERDARFVFKTGSELLVSELTETNKKGILKVVNQYNAGNSKNAVTLTVSPSSNPMDRIFQLIFILFFISPPLIVLLLFLIWREMKERNKMK